MPDTAKCDLCTKAFLRKNGHEVGIDDIRSAFSGGIEHELGPLSEFSPDKRTMMVQIYAAINEQPWLVCGTCHGLVETYVPRAAMVERVSAVEVLARRGTALEARMQREDPNAWRLLRETNERPRSDAPGTAKVLMAIGLERHMAEVYANFSGGPVGPIDMDPGSDETGSAPKQGCVLALLPLILAAAVLLAAFAA